jgi:hypothetical protein
MKDRAQKWEPVADIDAMFGSISFFYSGNAFSASMHGSRVLTLSFAGVIALRFENECPGLDPLPHPLPMLRANETFPLLVIEPSSWLTPFEKIYPGSRAHFVLISADHLVQILAEPNVMAGWQ